MDNKPENICPKCEKEMELTDGQYVCECGFTAKKNTEAVETSSMPELTRATEHEHTHKHGGFQHSHPHQHDKEHGIDGQLSANHEHPHDEKAEPPQEEKDETPEEEKAETKKESLRTMVFGEAVSLREAQVNRAKKTVEVTLIKPGWSLNGRYYSPELLGKCAGIFEGTKAFADHPSMSDDKDRPERSVLSITGYYTNVRQSEDGSLRATRHFVGQRGEEVYPLVLEAIANKPDLIGLSINALGRTQIGEAEGRQGVIVAELVKAISVDDVTVASAGGKYDRLMQSGDEMTSYLLKNISYEEWRESNPDFVARIKKEMRTARKEELEAVALKESESLKASLGEKEIALTEANATIEQLKESMKSAEQALADKEREVASRTSELVAELKLIRSKLPKEWCESVKPQLAGKTEEEMDKILETERVKFFAKPEPIKVTGAERVSESDMRDPKVVSVLEALGLKSEIYPRDDESPEQYAARKKQMRK